MTEMGPIVYSVVARRECVLTEYADQCEGNFRTLTRVLLAKFESQRRKEKNGEGDDGDYGESDGGRSRSVKKSLLSKRPLSLSFDKNYTFHLIWGKHLTFLVLAAKDAGVSVPHRFLRDLHNSFFQTFGDDFAPRAIAHACSDFMPQMKKLHDFYNLELKTAALREADSIDSHLADESTHSGASRSDQTFIRDYASTCEPEDQPGYAHDYTQRSSSVYSQTSTPPSSEALGNQAMCNYLRSQVRAVQSVMVENIDALLARSERVDMLVQKADEMNAQSFEFRRQVNQYNRRLWWRQKKTAIVCAVVVVGLLAVLIALLRSPFAPFI